MNVIELPTGVSWVYHCHEHDGVHTHLSQYVLTGDQNVLIDAGAGDEAEMKAAIREATDDGTVDALLLTQSVLPHTANVGTVEEEWDGVDVISASPLGSLVGLPNAKPKVLNSTDEVAGRQITFLDPLLTDVVTSNWIYDHESKTVFTAEGVGHYHDPSNCAMTTDEMGDIPFEPVHQFHKDNLAYLNCIDPAKLRQGFDAMLEKLDVECIAPMHGNPVMRSSIPTYVDTIIESAETFRAERPTRKQTG